MLIDLGRCSEVPIVLNASKLTLLPTTASLTRLLFAAKIDPARDFRLTSPRLDFAQVNVHVAALILRTLDCIEQNVPSANARSVQVEHFESVVSRTIAHTGLQMKRIAI